jgi:hypothetical protein
MENIMRAESISKYVILGTGYRYLQDAKPGIKIKGHGFILYNIDRIFEKFDELNLFVTKRAAYDLLLEFRIP